MHTRRLLAAILGFWLLLGGKASGQEWTRFRGPNGSGVREAANLPTKWTDQDYLWKVKLGGHGHSSPVLWGERVFVTSGQEKTGRRILQCLRAQDGHCLWSREFPGEQQRVFKDSSLASATPAVDSRRVFVLWGSPKQLLVVALDHDGRELWQADLGPFRSSYGLGASPIVHDDLLIVPNDQDGTSALLGLDCRTGQVRWKVPRRSKGTYTTPCIFQARDRPAEAIFTNYEHGFTSLDPRTGQKNWELDVFHKGHVETAIGSPMVSGDLVIGICGWLGVRQEVVAVRPGAKEGQVAFRFDRSGVLCTTPLAQGDLLFIWNDRGVVTCLNARTGEVRWRERVPGSYYASPVCTGPHLYNVSREGDVVVLAAADRFAQVAHNQLGEGSHSTPAIAAGRLYLRTFTHLMAVGK